MFYLTVCLYVHLIINAHLINVVDLSLVSTNLFDWFQPKRCIQNRFKSLIDLCTYIESGRVDMITTQGCDTTRISIAIIQLAPAKMVPPPLSKSSFAWVRVFSRFSRSKLCASRFSSRVAYNFIFVLESEGGQSMKGRGEARTSYGLLPVKTKKKVIKS